jgi:hypothetical protein
VIALVTKSRGRSTNFVTKASESGEGDRRRADRRVRIPIDPAVYSQNVGSAGGH